MPCRTDGGVIICGRGHRRKPCCSCGKPSSKLCDYPLRGRLSGKTCDRPICDVCAVKIDPKQDVDFCPTHAAMLDKGKLKL